MHRQISLLPGTIKRLSQIPHSLLGVGTEVNLQKISLFEIKVSSRLGFSESDKPMPKVNPFTKPGSLVFGTRGLKLPIEIPRGIVNDHVVCIKTRIVSNHKRLVINCLFQRIRLLLADDY